MRTLVLSLALVAGLGCSSITDELTLTSSEVEELSQNLQAGLEAQQGLSEFSYAAARGDMDLAALFADYTYVPPAGVTPGTLTINNGTFPFGTGTLVINFVVTGPGGPVDPYTTDLTDVDDITITGDYTFNGLSNSGGDLVSDARFTITALANAPSLATALIQGSFDVSHNGYDLDLDTNNLILDFDLLTGEVTDVLGNVGGKVDIPDFLFDANFDIEGLGNQLEISFDVVATEIRYLVDLIDL